MAQQYSSLPEDIALDDRPLRARRSDSISSASDSEVSYTDPMDIEPFDEKRDNRFQDEPAEESGFPMEPRRLRPRKRSKKTLAILIGILVFAAGIGALSAFAYAGPEYSAVKGNRHMTMDHIFNGTFSPITKRIDWVKEAPDGTYSHVDERGNIVLNTPQSPENGTILVNSEKIHSPEGQRLSWQSWALSADMEYVLFKTDHVKQWRHSSFGNYWIHRRSDLTTFPLLPPKNIPSISHVTWSPVGHSLAFVDGNDLYVVNGDQLSGDEPDIIRVTNDGSPVVFNGVPDWVYEEEVLSSDSALWWSPDGKTVAYLRSDEEKVPDYKLQYYNTGDDAFEIHQFPTEVDMKYPKPGNPNPLVDVHTFSLETYLTTGSLGLAKQSLTWPGEMPRESRVLMEVGWVADHALLVKEVDRAARTGSVVLFTNNQSEGKVVRKLGKDGEEGDDGWIDHGQDIIPLKGHVDGYLDMVPNNGYMHIALFTPLDATEPVWLTAGEWEVASIDGYNAETQTVYYTAAYPSIDRHLYAETLPSSDNLADFVPSPKALTDSSVPGYYEVSFSPGAKYYVLSYRGPKVPWQRLLEATAIEGDGIDILLEGNQKLNETLSEFMSPLVTRSTFEHDGIEMNMLEILPPNIDTSGRKKYPVLFRVYGGPGSQLVSNRYERDWQSYLACEKKFITIIVDGRGTGYRGREFRNPVMDKLGYTEVLDQVAAAREVAKRRYVDRARIGIWGWSYGGFMTCKTVEADSGVFSLGMAVAPVTNWLLYDSIYTERYMNTPDLNTNGYQTSSVLNVSSFAADKVDFLLAHGSGDDNVHYMNSASLLDKFTQEKVRGFRFRMFTDSHHAMDVRGAYRELYEMMTEFLDEKWGRGGTVRGT